jgi:hypothetical protein
MEVGGRKPERGSVRGAPWFAQPKPKPGLELGPAISPKGPAADPATTDAAAVDVLRHRRRQ